MLLYFLFFFKKGEIGLIFTENLCEFPQSRTQVGHENWIQAWVTSHSLKGTQGKCRAAMTVWCKFPGTSWHLRDLWCSVFLSGSSLKDQFFRVMPSFVP